MSGSDHSERAEPSMEEILTSIRRILHEDERVPLAPEAGAEGQDSVLVLDESMMVPGPETPAAGNPGAGAPVDKAAGEVPVAQAPANLRAARQENLAATSEKDAKPPEANSGAEAETMHMLPDDEHQDQHQIFQEADMSGKTEGPRGLIGENAAESASSHLTALTRTLSAERSVSVSRSGPTLEEIVRDELRPLLRSWLDTHLPGLVERVVRSEIERLVARTEL